MPGQQVQTKNGLVDRSSLTVKDIVQEHPNARVVATEWYLGTELVRRDVAVSILQGLPLSGEQANI